MISPCAWPQAETYASVDGDVLVDGAGGVAESSDPASGTPSPGRRTPGFLLGEDGGLDLDLDKRAGAAGEGGLGGQGFVGAGGEGEGAEEEDEEEDDGSERWIVCGGGEQDERGFDEDWMAAARYRARRELGALFSSMPKKSSGFLKEAKGSPQEALRKNVRVGEG